MAAKGLNLASLRRLRCLWQQDVQRLTLAELKMLHGGGEAEGLAGHHLEAAVRTHRELKVRIAHRLQDFLFLPYKVMANPSVRFLYEKYVNAYTMHEEFGELTSQAAVAEYWLALARTFDEHRRVTRLLGHGRRELIRLDPSLAPTLDAFFDRFFVSRIGTHLLGANFLHLVPPPAGGRKPAGVNMGVLQPTTPADCVRDLAQSLPCSSYNVPVEVEDAGDTSILYVPGHLRVILREILQNAIVATAKTCEAQGSPPVPVRVKVNKGQFGVFVTVSDRGGGIQSLDKIWGWGQDPCVPKAAEPEAPEDEEIEWSGPEAVEATDSGQLRAAAAAGFGLPLPLGFGLPLTRLTARYFGGDVRLQTLLGYGTNAYIHVPELQEEEELGEDDSGGTAK